MALDPTAQKAPQSHVKIGRLGRTFQLEGALRVILDEAVSYESDDGAEPVGVRALQASSQLFVTGLGNATVRKLYEIGGSLLLQLEGVRDRNAAQTLVNATLWVDPQQLDEDLAAELTTEVEAGSLEERLIGEPVWVNGEQVGEVSSAKLDSANPVLELTAGSGAKSLIPMDAPYVTITERGVEVTDPPPGLIDLI